MFRSPRNRTLSVAFGLTSTSLLLSSLGGCHLVLGLDEYEKDAGSSGGQGGGDPGSGGNASATGGQGGESGCSSNASCNDKNECTEDICNDSGICEHRTRASGSDCSGGVCNGRPGEEACQRCVDDQPGTIVDAGCTEGAPQCRLGSRIQCVGCETHGDCDDNNECTIDACSQDGACDYRPKKAGDSCRGGVCNGVDGAEACVECVDDEDGAATDSGCDVSAPLCSEGACEVCIDDQKGSKKDQGCTDNAPICSGSGCVECVNNSDCQLPNDECASVTCDGGQCEVTLHDDECTGQEGCPGVCKEAGCETLTLSQAPLELVIDPEFEFVDPEDGDYQTWFLAKSIDGGDFGIEPVLDSEYASVFVTSATARSGSVVARFTGAPNISYDIYQPLDVPADTAALVVSGYYRSVGNAPATNSNFVNGAFYNYDDDSIQFHDYFMTTKTGQPYSVVPVQEQWTKFEWRITDFSDFPTSAYPELNIFGQTQNSSGLVYEIDDISVKALICQ